MVVLVQFVCGDVRKRNVTRLVNHRSSFVERFVSNRQSRAWRLSRLRVIAPSPSTTKERMRAKTGCRLTPERVDTSSHVP